MKTRLTAVIVSECVHPLNHDVYPKLIGCHVSIISQNKNKDIFITIYFCSYSKIEGSFLIEVEKKV